MRRDRAHRTLLLWAGLALACVGSPEQTYPGPELPASEVAVLRVGSSAGVMALDGADTSGSAWALLPGRHEVWLRMRIHTQAPNVNWFIWSYCRVEFDAKAGESYETLLRHRKETAPGMAERVKIDIGITDSSGQLVGTPLTCTPDRPRLEGTAGVGMG